MKSKLIGLTLAACLAVTCFAADEIKFPVSFGRLAERASNSVDVTLDSSMLQFAGGFLSKEDGDEAQVKKLITKLKGVFVRSFEFDKDGQYSMADVEMVRAQLKGPEWNRIVSEKSTKKGENTEIFVKKNGESIAGLFVITTEPRELTVVFIDGPINPQELSELGGHMGIPKLDKPDSKKAKED
jgi:hypothetical protein